VSKSTQALVETRKGNLLLSIALTAFVRSLIKQEALFVFMLIKMQKLMYILKWKAHRNSVGLVCGESKYSLSQH